MPTTVEALAQKVRGMVRRQGFWVTCRWCKNQGYSPRWVVRAVHGLI